MKIGIWHFFIILAPSKTALSPFFYLVPQSSWLAIHPLKGFFFRVPSFFKRERTNSLIRDGKICLGAFWQTNLISKRRVLDGSEKCTAPLDHGKHIFIRIRKKLKSIRMRKKQNLHDKANRIVLCLIDLSLISIAYVVVQPNFIIILLLKIWPNIRAKLHQFLSAFYETSVRVICKLLLSILGSSKAFFAIKWFMTLEQLLNFLHISSRSF